MPDSPGLVAILAYDGLCTFEFGIAVEIFGLARPEMGPNWYRYATAAIEPGPLRAQGGLAAAQAEELEIAQKIDLPVDKVRKVLKIAQEPISLETPIGEEEDSHLGDFIEDKNAVIPLEAAIQGNLRESTTRVLATLTPREERVLRMRFGIGMNTDHTLEEVGQQFSVTRERIRQIEAKALRKLKHPSRSRKLRSFLDS